jgi:hypothetical protein
MAPANNNYSTPPKKAKKAAPIGGRVKNKVELSSQQVPTRFTPAVQEMNEVLSKFYINIYASCVLETERSGQSVSQHSCSKEFRPVIKACFRKVHGF